MTSKEIKIETIDNQSKPDIEYITPEYLETPNYEYWFNQQPLDYEKALRNKPTSWLRVKLGATTITSTWTLAITWIWFRPKLVNIISNRSANWISIGNSDWVSQFVDYIDDWWGAWTSNSLIINHRDAWSTKCQASLTSLNADWFTLDVTFLSVNTDIKYICYW